MKISLEVQTTAPFNYFYEGRLYSLDDKNWDIILFQNIYHIDKKPKICFLTDFLLINFFDEDKGFIKVYELIDFSSKSYRSHLIDLNLNPRMEKFEKLSNMRELAI